MALFTKETAATFSRLAVEKRRSDAERLRKLADERENMPLAQPTQPATTPPMIGRLTLVQDQIIRTRDALNERGIEPKDRAMLLNALDKLLDRERILLGIPLPGSKRPAQDKRASTAPTIGTVE